MTKNILIIILLFWLIVFVISCAQLLTLHQSETIENIFSTLNEQIGNNGYIVSSFYVFEDDSYITVYLVYNDQDELIYQFPEWTQEKELG